MSIEYFRMTGLSILLPEWNWGILLIYSFSRGVDLEALGVIVDVFLRVMLKKPLLNEAWNQ